MHISTDYLKRLSLLQIKTKRMVVCTECGGDAKKWKWCAHCLKVPYCSKSCQQTNWTKHRKDCMGKSGDFGPDELVVQGCHFWQVASKKRSQRLSKHDGACPELLDDASKHETRAFELAVDKFKQAASAGHPHAQHSLASLYLAGHGTVESRNGCIQQLLEASAAQGNKRAQCRERYC